ncbi:hypothetical protein HPP92_004778 [Vanilla planifolia]|uniref:Uncharacterized protein n=1 Tax=Vanilla planifolia TaxID=51239 RepID=A0A835VBZ9_VANPL|nr:hypothetical protein HPP92_004778 [Vanilla planifolia]
MRYQYYLDKATPFVLRRWIAFVVVAIIYFLRVALLDGFYIVSYGLGIYVLSLFIAFLSPQVDPEMQHLLDSDGPSLQPEHPMSSVLSCGGSRNLSSGTPLQELLLLLSS